MIRLIINTQVKDKVSGAECDHYQTFDLENKKLESLLGYSFNKIGKDCYEMGSIVGAEVIKDD